MSATCNACGRTFSAAGDGSRSTTLARAGIVVVVRRALRRWTTIATALTLASSALLAAHGYAHHEPPNVVAWHEDPTLPPRAAIDALTPQMASAVRTCARQHPAPTPEGGGMVGVAGGESWGTPSIVVVLAPTGRVVWTGMQIPGLGRPATFAARDAYWNDARAFARCFDSALRRLRVAAFSARTPVRVTAAYDGPLG